MNFKLLNGRDLVPRDVDNIISVGGIEKSESGDTYFSIYHQLFRCIVVCGDSEKLDKNRNELLLWIEQINKLKGPFHFCNGSMVTREAEIERVSKLSHSFNYNVRFYQYEIEFDDQSILEKNYQDFKNWVDFVAYL